MTEVLFTIDQERAQAERAGMSVGISSSEICVINKSRCSTGYLQKAVSAANTRQPPLKYLKRLPSLLGEIS